MDNIAFVVKKSLGVLFVLIFIVSNFCAAEYFTDDATFFLLSLMFGVPILIGLHGFIVEKIDGYLKVKAFQHFCRKNPEYLEKVKCKIDQFVLNRKNHYHTKRYKNYGNCFCCNQGTLIGKIEDGDIVIYCSNFSNYVFGSSKPCQFNMKIKNV